MSFNITKMWYEMYHNHHMKGVTILYAVVKWLEENVGDMLNDNFRYLPCYGQQWRIEHTPSGDNPGIYLTIDDDSQAVMFKLMFGDDCDKNE